MDSKTISHPLPKHTEELLLEFAKLIPRPAAGHCVVRPGLKSLLLCDFPEAAKDDLPRIDLVKYDFGTIQIIEKPGQRAAAWMIDDPSVVRAYIEGYISEEDLERVSASVKSA